MIMLIKKMPCMWIKVIFGVLLHVVAKIENS